MGILNEKVRREKKKKNKKKDEIDQDHAEFELSYCMMLGIRHTVSKAANAPQKRKIAASLGNLTLQDDDEAFAEINKYSFPKAGSPTTPAHEARDFFFKDYMPDIFNQLREWFAIDPVDYLTSIGGNFNLLQFISNSKSGEFFFYSHDRKFLIKTMSKSESLLLRRLMPAYFNYISRQPNTFLTKFYGMHRVKTAARSSPVYFLIMGSVFNSRHQIHTIYDLKGSLHKRRAKVPKGPQQENQTTTQKDMNWLDTHNRIEIPDYKAKLFVNQLRADIEFLKRSKIMDYSLLLGIHDFSRDEAPEMQPSLDKNEVAKPQTFSVNTRVRKSMKYIAKVPTELGVDLQVPEAMEKIADHEHSQPLERDSMSDKRRSNPFTEHEGGMLSAKTDLLYFVGIIDILQLYNKRKKLEHFGWKARPNIDSNIISCVPPDNYGNRMYQFLVPSIGTQEFADKNYKEYTK